MSVREKRKHRKEVACRIMCVVSALFLAWLLFSVIDTNVHNASHTSVSGWNFFQIVLKFNGRI